MNKLKNFISGQGRLNRRQFLIMFILTALTVWVINLLAEIGVVSYFWTWLNAIWLLFFITFIVELLIWLPFMLAFVVRRGHDFWLNATVSSIYVIIVTVIYLLPGLYDVLGEFSILLEGLLILTFLVFLFTPGNKKSNQYWNAPTDTGRPKRIFQYMKTGNWSN